MRRTTAFLFTTALVGASLFVAAGPAQAHGYISSPPSRQALCAQGVVKGCGDIVYEPQSVEAAKGSRLCSGGNPRFPVLDDASKNWPATAVGESVTFAWTLTARHSSSNWQYFVGGTRVAVFEDGGRIPNATVSHTVDLSAFSGRQTVLAVWSIADTPNAFYSCIDLNVGGDPDPGPTPSVTATPEPTPSVTTPATTAQWATYTPYAIGQRVTYNGRTYTCRQAHTALPGWEPAKTLALWLPA